MSSRCPVWGGLLALVLAASAVAGEPLGPPFGANTISTEIRNAYGEDDVDDFVASLVEGESLGVKLSAAKGSALLPTIMVLDPDGNDRTPALKVKSGGAKVSFKKLAVDVTGRWTVRVVGTNGTEGAYSVKFSTGKAKPTRLKKQSTVGGLATHVFGTIEDALVSIDVKYAKSGAPVAVASLKDPTGANAVSGTVFAAGKFVTKGTKISLKKQPLGKGDGDYALNLVSAGGEGSYSVKISVAPQDRPKGKGTVPAVEPYLAPREEPILGVAGRSITLTGAQLGSTTLVPTVLFGSAPGQVTSVAADGTSLSVLPPTGTHGATVEVSVVDAFGQASQREGYFTYVPPPTLTRLEDTLGAVVTGGTTLGGATVRLIGTGFEPGQTIQLGSRSVVNPVLVSANEWRFGTPATGTDGVVSLFLTDNYGRRIASGFPFTYKRPPTVSGSAASTYSPTVGRAAGGTVVTVTGTGFDLLDRIEVDGGTVSSTYVSTTRRTFVMPARSPGFYPVALIDRYDVTVDLPDFEVKAPPTITSATLLSGLVRNQRIGIGGGALLRVDGTGFSSTDSVTIGGSTVTPDLQGSTRMEIEIPSVAPGSLAVVVTDVFGDTASLSDVARAAGLDDATATRSPGASTSDRLSAVAAATGDLDGDGKDDDVVLVGATNGSRAMRTRQLRGNSSGVLADVTGSAMPSAGADPLGVSFDGTAVAIGDLDGQNGPEIVVADQTYFAYSSYYYYDAVRVLANDGTGVFTYSSTLTPPASYYYYGGYVVAATEYGYSYVVGIVAGPQPGTKINALAIGDLDRDGDEDVVSTMGSGALAFFYRYPSVIDFTTTPYYISYYDVLYGYSPYYPYVLPGTRILDNAGRLVDRSLARIGVADYQFGTKPGFYGKDLAIGDVDGVNGPDIVVTWDDPATVSVYGNESAFYYGTSYDISRTATRVLINNGKGAFSDGTTAWIPGGGTNEYWQGDAVRLVDVVGSSGLDLVILHDTGPSSSTSALRVLRNDGVSTGFTDVTSAVIPAVTQLDNFAGTSLLVADVDGDGLLDIVVGTERALFDGSGSRARSTRVLFGTVAGTFLLGTQFQEAATVDTQEVRFLLVGDLETRTKPTILLGTDTLPTTGPTGERLRIFDWTE